MIWCATGFSDSPNTPFYKKLFAAANLFFRSTKTIDIDGIGRIGKLFDKANGYVPDGPRVILVSSAGVTRTIWSDEKKLKYEGCADSNIITTTTTIIIIIIIITTTTSTTTTTITTTTTTTTTTITTTTTTIITTTMTTIIIVIIAIANTTTTTTTTTTT